jgi:hypothetical protein
VKPVSSSSGPYSNSASSSWPGEGLTVLDHPAGRLVGYVLAAAVAGVRAAIAPARRAAKVDVLRAVAAA